MNVANIISLILLGICLFLISCGIFDSKDSKEICPEQFSDEIRIIPCKGIDGVEFGDSYEDVISILGEYDSFGYAHGPDRSWQVIGFKEGAHVGLMVFFIEKPINEYGPVDVFEMDTLYTGKTEKGIGIGSNIEEVKAAYGEPVKTHPSGDWLSYLYCFGDKELYLNIDNGIVRGMNIRYHEPPLEYTTCN